MVDRQTLPIPTSEHPKAGIGSFDEGLQRGAKLNFAPVLRPEAEHPLDASRRAVITPHLHDAHRILGDLLLAARPQYSGKPETECRLWAKEAVNRATDLLNLFLKIETETWHRVGPTIRSCLDQALASNLLDIYHSIEKNEPQRLVPCTPTVRSISEGLVELFARAVGDLKIDLELASISLSPVKRRALALVVSEIILDFISEGFPGRGHGRIYVDLEKRCGNSARLAIDSNGLCVSEQRLENTLAIAGQLISVLDGDLVIRKSRFGGWRFEIEFPVGPLTR